MEGALNLSLEWRINKARKIEAYLGQDWHILVPSLRRKL